MNGILMNQGLNQKNMAALLPWPRRFLHQKSEDLGGDLRWSEPFDSVQVVVVLDRGGVAGSLFGVSTP